MLQKVSKGLGVQITGLVAAIQTRGFSPSIFKVFLECITNKDLLGHLSPSPVNK